ncbi:MAG: radical SAM protein [Kofleriaceae bacterium]|nr:radical SAM protein [Kofleriaceae bacterium]
MPGADLPQRRDPYAALAATGEALARALRAAAPGPDDGGVRAAVDAAAPPTPRSWRDAVDALVDRADATVRPADWLAPDLLARRPCTLPWTRLELFLDDLHGPCCVDFQRRPAAATGALLARFRSPAMRAFRAALAGDGPPATCRPSCPRLRGRSDALDHLVVRGGPAAFVANQRAVVEAIVAGDVDAAAITPLELSFAATSFCNYDCLMCRWGVDGTLADERPAAFYDALAPLLPGLARLEVLGGEPLASPVFRDFLAGPTLAAHRHVRVALTTNASYLTPTEQARHADVRFEHLTISLNAATDATYRAVNRGLTWPRIRGHLDALRARRAATGWPRAITYSMVMLRANLHELEAFAALARRDGVGVRFMLPMRDRNDQSFLRDAAAMADVARRLRAIADDLDDRDARRARGEAEVLDDRLARGVLRPLPDDGDDVAAPVRLSRR